TPAKLHTNATAPGFQSPACTRSSQLTANRTTMTTFPIPCRAPIRLALLPAGIASQSISPKTAAARPPITPVAMAYADPTAKPDRLVTRYRMSKITAVTNRPNGNTINSNKHRWCKREPGVPAGPVPLRPGVPAGEVGEDGFEGVAGGAVGHHHDA